MEKQFRIISLCAFAFFGHQMLLAQKNKQDTISTATTITAFSLPIKNIVVTNKGDLHIISSNSVAIEGPFEVMLGGTLTIGIQKPNNIVFIYDKSGNRIARKPND